LFWSDDVLERCSGAMFSSDALEQMIGLIQDSLDFDIRAQNCVIFMLKTQICLKCSITTS
jgi:hypothetical protein